ncbi:hypothetical protein [Xanthomonas arboricola]|uniref:hypothetical protein n=1 Tax=Xanthomonas arboricola TaxID=56448 RepID=UPI0016BB276B
MIASWMKGKPARPRRPAWCSTDRFAASDRRADAFTHACGCVAQDAASPLGLKQPAQQASSTIYGHTTASIASVGLGTTQRFGQIGGPRLFAIGIERPEPGCQIAAVVNEAVSDALQEAERLLVERLASISLAVLVQTLEELRDPVSV